MTTTDTILSIIEEPLAASQTEVVDIQLTSGFLRVMIDRPGGVDLDVVTEVSHLVSELLDAADPIAESYTLEVSSPGLERPLRTPAHFQRFIGSQIAIKTNTAIQGQRRFKGELTSADNEGFTIEKQRFTYDQLDKARTVFVWEDEGVSAEQTVKGKAS